MADDKKTDNKERSFMDFLDANSALIGAVFIILLAVALIWSIVESII